MKKSEVGQKKNALPVMDLATPEGLYEGIRAITSQPYTEANVKNGLQYYVRVAWPLLNQLSAGQSAYISFTTSSKKVLAKTRIVSYVGEEFSLQIFASPTIPLGQEGVLRSVGNYNGVNPIPSTVTVYRDVNMTGGSEGTPLDDEPEYYFGATATGQRAANSIPEGRERVLPENTTFLIKITNTGTGNGRIQYFLDWYEGEPDLPL